MGRQTAVRRGNWKLVLNGQVIESDRTQRPIGQPQPAVFLADLDADPGETRDLSGERSDMVRELRAAAEVWRARIEERWEREWTRRIEEVGVTAHE